MLFGFGATTRTNKTKMRPKSLLFQKESSSAAAAPTAAAAAAVGRKILSNKARTITKINGNSNSNSSIRTVRTLSFVLKSMVIVITGLYIAFAIGYYWYNTAPEKSNGRSRSNNIPSDLAANLAVQEQSAPIAAAAATTNTRIRGGGASAAIHPQLQQQRQQQQQLLSGSSSSSSTSCQFRKYPPHRYYHRKKRPLPSFLTHRTEYIYGEFPTMLVMPLSSSSPKSTTTTTTNNNQNHNNNEGRDDAATTNHLPRQKKLCVDQSEWYHQGEGDTTTTTTTTTHRLPFADGTNPSLLKIKDNPRLIRHGLSSAATGSSTAGVSDIWGKEAYYLATLCMTNSQCTWKDTPQQRQDFFISDETEPATVRTVLLVLDQNFQILEQTTIETLIDANFGRRIKPPQPPHPAKRMMFALDDARLFTYQNEIWISYREGPNFGYDKQVLHPLHLERITRSDHANGGNNKPSKSLQATLKASEVETLCCGRNMALLDNVHTHQLQALTWVDPITVETVNLKHTTTTTTAAETQLKKQRRRRLSLDNNSQGRRQQRRRLSDQGGGTGTTKKKKSDFHGTNGFMVHLPMTNEYLGIGHFHRPPGRDANDYARFGHHYTHAFFTIPDQPPFHLKRLSPELLLPSYAHPDDAEIIQFWSGLEHGVGNDNHPTVLALAYGINDCEGAATYIDMEMVESLLRKVPQGKEVVDLLASPPQNR